MTGVTPEIAARKAADELRREGGLRPPTLAPDRFLVDPPSDGDPSLRRSFPTIEMATDYIEAYCPIRTRIVDQYPELGGSSAPEPAPDKDRWYVDPPSGSDRVGMYCDSLSAAEEVAATYPPHTRIVDTKQSPDSPAAQDLAAYNAKVNPVNPPNPKQRYGDTKVNLALVPSSGVIYAALGFHDGAVKYGPFNWRQDAVEIMTYVAAAMRHLSDFVDGEELSEIELWPATRPDGDKDTTSVRILGGKPHLGHALACLMILADAISLGHVIDNRPLPGPSPTLFQKWKRDLAR